jgi:hypothetical protein
MSRSLINLKLIVVQGETQESTFSLLHLDIQFSQHHLLKRLSFLHCVFWTPLLKISWLYICGFMSGSSILIHWSSSLFLCWYHAVVIVMVLQYSLKSGIVMPSALDFLLRIALFIQGFLCFHMYFKIDISFSVQNVTWILIGIAFNM